MKASQGGSSRAGAPGRALHRAVGRNIRERRRALGLTLETLEERCGVGAAFIGQIERTDKRGSVETLGRIADGLRLPLGQLLRSDAPAQPRGEAGWLLSLLRPHDDRERQLLYDTLRLLSRRLRALSREAR